MLSTLVCEGLCGEIRLADFDALSLSNLKPGGAGGIACVGIPYVRVVMDLRTKYHSAYDAAREATTQ